MDKARAWWADQKLIEKVVAVLGVLLLVVVAISVANMGGGVDQPRDRTDHARDECHDAVRARLKDPGSAEIANATQTGGSQGPWTFSGTATAANSYGGTARVSWSCNVTMGDDLDFTVSANVSG